MIVRDEEDLLADCLDSVQGVVDEIIVVDTGSKDLTPVIACAAGATLLQHAWNDDFSAARNAALQNVEDGYVLILDADEVLAPGAGESLRAALESADFDLGLLPLYDASTTSATPEQVLAGTHRIGEPLSLPRLFRYTDDLRWEGIVHEHITKWAQAHPRRTTIEAPIVHYGAVPELRKRRGKDDRNLYLLRTRAEREPANPAVQRFLSHHLLLAGQVNEAREHAARAWELALEVKGDDAHLELLATATAHAFHCLSVGALEEAEEVLAVALERAGSHPNIDFLEAVRIERAWRPERDSSHDLVRGMEASERALSARGEAPCVPVLPGATSWGAATVRGHLALLGGDANGALSSFKLALEAKSDHAPALLGSAEALSAAGDPAAALSALEPLLQDGPPDAWILAAEAGSRFGDPEFIEPFVRRARAELKHRALVAPHRGAFLERLESYASGSSSAPRHGH